MYAYKVQQFAGKNNFRKKGETRKDFGIYFVFVDTVDSDL